MENKKTAMQHLIHVIENEFVGDQWDKLKEAILKEEKEQMEAAYMAGYQKSVEYMIVKEDELQRVKLYFEEMYKNSFEI